jgi:hypothetical protein
MDDVPVRVRVYAILVAVAAGIGFVVATALDADAWSRTSSLLAVALLVAAIVAQRFPVHLSEKTKVYVDAALFTAAALLLPPLLAMLVAAAAVGVGHLAARSSWRQAVFNVAQTALYVGAGAVTYQWLNDSSVPPTVPGLGSALAILAAAVVMHLLNTGLVAGVVALQLDRNPYRTWRDGILLDLPQHLVLVAIGVLLAVVARDYPWLAPLFIAPLAFVYLSLRRSLELRRATHSTLLAAVDLVELLHRAPPGHSRRVAGRARQLAERLGLEPDEVDDVETAARLHVLGEPSDRPEVAGGEAGRRVAGHSAGVAAPLAAFPSYSGSVVVIRHLTERWDGTGYPDRLAGEAIPLPSRVIAVADAFDSLVTGAGGRDRPELEETLVLLRAGAGRAWDPRVVEEMVAVAHGDLVANRPDAVTSGPAVSGVSASTAGG